MVRRYIYLLFTILVWIHSLSASAIDGERAMGLIRAQCELGPRVPGTSAHLAEKKWIISQIEGLGLKVWEQPFRAKLALTGQEVSCWNIWGLPAADGPSSPSMILSAHWDTRPWADQDPGGGKPSMLGANDGASGVALALELARELRSSPVFARHVVLAFWDAEDAGINNDSDSWGTGSRWAAAHPPAWIGRINFGINLDMVAGEGSPLRPESYSRQAAPWAVDSLWSLGQSLAPDVFEPRPLQTMIDDHLPWIRRGMPFVDLIGWPYKYWHTAGDTPEHCRSAVMEAVGNVVYNFILDAPWQKSRPAGL